MKDSKSIISAIIISCAIVIGCLIIGFAICEAAEVIASGISAGLSYLR